MTDPPGAASCCQPAPLAAHPGRARAVVGDPALADSSLLDPRPRCYRRRL